MTMKLCMIGKYPPIQGGVSPLSPTLFLGGGKKEQPDRFLK